MAARKKADKPPVAPARVEEIRADARSARNWAQENNFGPACLCGLRAARGECFRHGKKKKKPKFLQPGPPGPGGDDPGPGWL